ncbi:ComEC/Rec2 family competence protein [Mycolicibacterium phlei]
MAEPGATPLDLRLVPAAATAWAVSGAGILWPTAGAVLAAIAAVTVTAAAGWWVRRDRPRRVGPGLAAVAVVAATFAIAITLQTDQLRDHPVTQRYGTVAAVVVTPTETPRIVGGHRAMFRGALLEVDDRAATGGVVVFLSGRDVADLSAGTPVRVRARIGRPTRRDLTVAVLSVIGTPSVGEAAAIHRAAHGVRSEFAAAARRALPADQAAMLPALVLGDTSAVPRQTTADFRTSGLTHLTAVSGANVTIVCGAVLLTAVLVGPRVAVGLAAVALLAFVVVVQPSASVLRAAVMGAITLLAILSHRRRQAIPALAASVLMLMVASPQLAVDIGFALSVSATAALVVIAPVWTQRLTVRGWPEPLAAAVSVAVAAQLVTAPLVAGMAGMVSVVAVAANLAVAPVIAPITVAGTAAAALSPLWPAGAELLIRLTGPELWWLLAVSRWAAAVPGAALPVPPGPVGAVLIALAGVAVVVGWRSRGGRVAVCATALALMAWTVSGLSGGHDTIAG